MRFKSFPEALQADFSNTIANYLHLASPAFDVLHYSAVSWLEALQAVNPKVGSNGYPKSIDAVMDYLLDHKTPLAPGACVSCGLHH